MARIFAGEMPRLIRSSTMDAGCCCCCCASSEGEAAGGAAPAPPGVTAAAAAGGGGTGEGKRPFPSSSALLWFCFLAVSKAAGALVAWGVGRIQQAGG